MPRRESSQATYEQIWKDSLEAGEMTGSHAQVFYIVVHYFDPRHGDLTAAEACDAFEKTYGKTMAINEMRKRLYNLRETYGVIMEGNARTCTVKPGAPVITFMPNGKRRAVVDKVAKLTQEFIATEAKLKRLAARLLELTEVEHA